MAETQLGILVNLSDSGNGTPQKEVDEIENTRMVADPEMADCIMRSPTMPHHHGEDSDDLITNEEFNFDVPLSPSSNIGNSTFTKEVPEVCEVAEEDEDEVFFGPVGFAEVVVKKAVEVQEADTKMWVGLTDAEMKEVMSEANRMAELIQEARETTDSKKDNDIPDSAASPNLQSNKEKSLPATSELPEICSLTVTKSPNKVTVCKESLKQVQTKLFTPSSTPSQKDIPKTRSKATPSSSEQSKKQPNSAPSARPVRRTENQSRRSGSGLKPPSSSKSQLQEPKATGTKRKKLDMNHSSDELHTSLNTSNSSDATSETAVPTATKSRLAVPSQSNKGSCLRRPSFRSQLQVPKVSTSKRTKLDEHQSADELHTSLNSSTSSEMSVDTAVTQPAGQTRRSLPLPSKVSKLPSGLPKPGGNGQSGGAQQSATSATSTAKPAIKSTLTKLDKLKSSLGAGISRIGGGPSRLVKPGSTSSMLARPSGPMKALKPAAAGPGIQGKRLTTAGGLNKKATTSPVKSDNRRKSIGSPAGHLTPKRTGVSRSQSFSGQRTPSQKASSGNTPGSAQRRSLLPTVNRRERTLSSSSSMPSSIGSSLGETPCTPSVLKEIQNIADASPSCFKPKTSRILHTPLAKESTAKSKVSRWSPVPRRKPMSGEEFFTCTKRNGTQN